MIDCSLMSAPGKQDGTRGEMNRAPLVTVVRYEIISPSEYASLGEDQSISVRIAPLLIVVLTTSGGPVTRADSFSFTSNVRLRRPHVYH